MSDTALAHALIAEAKRRLLDESILRIRTCLDQFTPEELWRRPNAETVSAGDLVLHLCGNARQWIGAGLDGMIDDRDRDAEFAPKDPMTVEELRKRVDDTAAMIDAVLTRLAPEELLRTRRVQCFDETGLAILVHVVEHFSYHVGQITYILKSRQAVDTRYYGDLPLNS